MMCNEEWILQVTDLSKEYEIHTDVNAADQGERSRFKKKTASNNAFAAVQDVSFKLRKGEIVGLIGANGAGKSTLLKLISRITAPTRGEICLNGRVTSLLEVGTGFHPELTGRENIYLNGSIMGMSRKEIDAKMDSIIRFSECADFIDTPVKRYSSGMYVKLAFAVAVHLDAEIMIMDEVLAVGDIRFQKKCIETMSEIAAQQDRTILYVSHNMDTVRRLCRRCLILDHGKLIFDGPTDQAIRIYQGDELRTETSMDLSRYLRPGWLGREDARLLWAEYPQNASKVPAAETRELHLRWKLNAPVQGLGLRIELLDDQDRPFATKVFYDVFSGDAGECGEGTFQLPLHHVMNGVYGTYYTLFQLDHFQETVDLDCVRGLALEVNSDRKDLPMKWVASSWGNVQL